MVDCTCARRSRQILNCDVAWKKKSFHVIEHASFGNKPLVILKDVLMKFLEHCLCCTDFLACHWVSDIENRNLCWAHFIRKELSHCLSVCHVMLLVTAKKNFLLEISLIKHCMFECCNVTVCQVCYKQHQLFL